MKYIALDFETSGLSPGVHAPVSLAVALMDGEQVIDSKSWTIAPPVDKNGKISRAYDVVALEISGTSWKAIKNGTPPAGVCHELYDWTHKMDAVGLTVVAFNAPFDFTWYSDLLFLGGSWNQQERRFQTFMPPLVGPWQCARLMAVVSLDCPGYSLDNVCAAFGLSREGNVHGAAEDAYLAGVVYSRLLSKLSPEAA